MKKVFVLVLMLCVYAIPSFASTLRNKKYAEYLQYEQKANVFIEEYQEARETLDFLLSLDARLNAKIEIGSSVYNDLFKLADMMLKALENSITQTTAKQIIFTDYLFEASKDSDSMHATLLSLYTSVYDSAMGDLEIKSEELKNTLTAAFKDSVLDDDEYTAISEILKGLDELFELAYPSELREK